MQNLNRIEPIRSQHSCMYGKKRTPINMQKSSMDEEQRQFFEQEALSIFADMTNNGFTFQESITSVFISGMMLYHEVVKNKIED